MTLAMLVPEFQQLLIRLEKARKRVGITHFPAWYRGVTDESYELLPSLLRKDKTYKLKHESNTLSVFATMSAGRLPAAFDREGGWDHLFLMQHHGVPTRLLDWTESLDVALFFATKKSDCPRPRPPNPAIWVLNPFALNRAATEKPIIYDDADRLPYSYRQVMSNGQGVPHRLPIAAQPTWISERVERQHGCFTIHGTCQEPLEKLKAGRLKKVTIPSNLVKLVRQYLRDRRIDWFTLFGDLDHLAIRIIDRFSL